MTKKLKENDSKTVKMGLPSVMARKDLGHCSAKCRNETFHDLQFVTLYQLLREAISLEIVKVLIMQLATLSKYDAFNLVWNRLGNTQGKADFNFTLDLIMEHQVKAAKDFLDRLGANFSPGIAQAYTRALDALRDLVEDIEESLG